MKATFERDSSDAVSVRNLDQIQEEEPHRGASKLGAMVMASFGGACIVFCSLMLVRSPSSEAPKGGDPLGALVASTPSTPKKRPKPALEVDDVTFPELLSDNQQKTTALAAVREERAAAVGSANATPDDLPRGAGREPPPATDHLPVVPLPAQDVLHPESPRLVASADTLQSVAQKVAREPAPSEAAPAGGPGGFQLQVSSFKSREEAEAFAMALRRRSHKAHIEEANVPGRGTWFRVRLGPFRYKRSAQLYREEFEAKERMVTFIVDPPKNDVSISVTDAAE
ncbi:MAG: SPOR domain-containing protein [Deltaproteobacteria bacterium]|nr:SPOR domain-containing protein [Deltaproteobacteria bacterium]